MAPPPFRFGGRRALDLTWTLRYRAVAPTELLVEPNDLDRWLDAAGFDRQYRRTSRRELELARTLREATDRSARRQIDGQPLAPADIKTINDLARDAPLRQLASNGQTALAQHQPSIRSLLATLAHEAVELLGTDQHGRLKRCDGEHCALLFVDDSRAGKRRWCSVEVCGNLANLASHRARQPGRR
jgi:predicted RNA-binding Zn ribbon-like protein